MLAEQYTGEENIDGWIMSEKLDGVRCKHIPHNSNLKKCIKLYISNLK